MADFVLDTHTCVYSLLSPGKLGKSARKELERSRQQWNKHRVCASCRST
jgi:PIN domain nuclease of toxin-antitoxin system